MRETDLRLAGSLEGEDTPENALRILRAAVDLFACKGYAATSVREIVQEARVTNPMLYYYFDSKEGLFVALTERIGWAYRRDIRAAMSTPGPLEAVLTRVVDSLLRWVREKPTVLRFVYSLLFGAQGSCPPHRLNEVHEEIVDSLVELLAERTAQGEFRPTPELDLRWSTHQLLGVVKSYSMRLIREMDAVPESMRDAWVGSQASPDAAARLVQLFLYGAGEVVQ